MTTYKVPTGHICTMEGEKGKELEFLSIGDYGRNMNVKADFLGLTEPINGVPNTSPLLPLEEKWVITISSQYGCSMNCSFCDVPKVGSGINATEEDMVQQVFSAMKLHPEVSHGRINLHYARMGEPTWNPAVLDSVMWLRSLLEGSFNFHPVVSTMMPRKNVGLEDFLVSWLLEKNGANGDAGLQISINTTDINTRALTMPESHNIYEISSIMSKVLTRVGKVKGRKITLNFALTEAEVDASLIRILFDPSIFLCKLTPMHKTDAVVKEGMITDEGYDHFYPYEKVEQDLIKEGFDVIVFIPSRDEDESKITCGNALLSTKGSTK